MGENRDIGKHKNQIIYHGKAIIISSAGDNEAWHELEVLCIVASVSLYNVQVQMFSNKALLLLGPIKRSS